MRNTPVALSMDEVPVLTRLAQLHWSPHAKAELRALLSVVRAAKRHTKLLERVYSTADQRRRTENALIRAVSRLDTRT